MADSAPSGGTLPTMSDVERWAERQRALSGIGQAASAPDVDDVESTTRSLAELLWAFHDDGRLWKLLTRQQLVLDGLDGDARARLLAAMQIDWEPFLVEAGYSPPPPAAQFADEFRFDLHRAVTDPGANADVPGLRSRVADLATTLDRTLADTRPSRLRKMLALLRAAGGPAARRAALVNGVGALAGVGTEFLLGPIAAAAAGAAVRGGLDRVLPKAGVTTVSPPSRQAARKAARYFLDFAEYGSAQSNFNLLRKISIVGPQRDVMDSIGKHEPVELLVWDGPQPNVMDSLRTRAVLLRMLVDWVDRTLASVFMAWETAEQSGSEVLSLRLESTATTLAKVRAELADLTSDFSGLDDQVEALGAQLHELAKLIGHADVRPPMAT